MSLNWKEIDLILEELQLPATFIQQIRQPDYSSLVIELHRPGDSFSLFISLAGGTTRLHRSDAKFRNPRKPPRFVEFLRSRIRGGRITEASQVGRERVVKLYVSRSGEDSILWIRLWSGAANIIVTDPSHTILETFYRRPGRGETAGGKYDPETELLKNGNVRSQESEYSIRDLPGEASFNEKIAKYYQDLERRGRLERLRKQAEQTFRTREAKLRSTIEKLKKKLNSYSRSDQFRELGDLILSNLHLIRKGDSWVTVQDFFHDNQDRMIELDPTLDPKENAEKYYQKHRKSRSGLSVVEEEIASQERELARLEEQREELLSSEDVGKLGEFLREAGRERKRQEKDTSPGLRFFSHGFVLIVGRTAKENDELLRRHVRGNDFWLHSRDYPGAYVFIRSKPGKSVPLEVLLDAGNLALFYSKGRGSAQGDLYYTQVKYLRRPKEGKTGLVLPTQEKNLFIRLDPQRLEKLQNGEKAG